MKIIGFSIDVDDEQGIANSWTLTRTWLKLLLPAGEAAQARKFAIIILIDEV